MSAPAAASSASSPQSASGDKDDLSVKIDYKSLPPVKIAIRSRTGVEFRTGPFAEFTPTTGENQQSDCNGDGQILYSHDGARVALVKLKNVQILDTETHQQIAVINRPRIEHLWFSPQSTYLASWDRKTLENKQSENLHVWRVSDGAEVLKVHWNDLDATQQRPVQWTYDETIMGLLVTNEVRFFNALAPVLAEPISRISCKGVQQFAFAPAVKPYQLAVFLPGKQTDPARVNVYHVPTPSSTATAASAASSSSPADSSPTASKSFYKAEEVDLLWSPLGTSILIETRTSTDKTGKSYYGESGLHLLHADGSYQGTVPFGTNPGPIQDVKWSPTGKEFMVIQGFQPAKSTLFVAANCTPIREYGTKSRNTIRWSPHGRFVVLGGFGNLAGEMDFWDHFKFKCMGSAIDRDGAKSFEWTADGRYFITAALRPWRRVDNGYKIWTYAGEEVYKEGYEELWQVACQPAPVGVYPNRPQSPRLSDKRKLAAAAAASGTTGSTSAAAPLKTGAYIPPHLRAQGATAPSTIMKRENEAAAAPRKLNSVERAAITGEPVQEQEGGMSKSQLKRSKVKASAARKADEEAKKQAEEAEAAAKIKAEEDAKRNDLSDPAVVARKLKASQKKLRQIVELKERKAAGDALNEDQQSKIDSEAELQKEVEQLTLLAKA